MSIRRRDLPIIRPDSLYDLLSFQNGLGNFEISPR
jgi:hypothetical protein